VKRSIRLCLIAIPAAALGLACGGDTQKTDHAENGEPGTPAAAEFTWPEGPRDTAVIEVEGRGSIHIALYPEIAPNTVDNFTKLAREGFYDGTTFHRVIRVFMIQGGDPNSKDDLPNNDGGGGPGYTIEDEFSQAPQQRGVLSMANSGRVDSAGSQFFILHRDTLHLNGRYTAFGRVTEGMDVVDAIAEVETDQHGRWGPKDRPLENVVIQTIRIQPATKPQTNAPPSPADTP
jgi:peptidyl-prolyl cis-trans isomerase B (cyclophilin B)